jgi:hypothetical protein
MGAMRRGLSGLGASLLCLSGCWMSSWMSTGPQMKPPPPPPEYVLPPSDDARFSQPPAFPEKTLNQGLQKTDTDPLNPLKDLRNGPAGRFGGGGPGGMGGPQGY